MLGSLQSLDQRGEMCEFQIEPFLAGLNPSAPSKNTLAKNILCRVSFAVNSLMPTRISSDRDFGMVEINFSIVSPSVEVLDTLANVFSARWLTGETLTYFSLTCACGRVRTLLSAVLG